tara:strand:+ start:432 stop:758 length:327 start_codon:yes stop_codon:yes gene_type:complete
MGQYRLVFEIYITACSVFSIINLRQIPSLEFTFRYIFSLIISAVACFPLSCALCRFYKIHNDVSPMAPQGEMLVSEGDIVLSGCDCLRRLVCTHSDVPIKIKMFRNTK